jgi:hypothetical protein
LKDFQDAMDQLELERVLEQVMDTKPKQSYKRDFLYLKS